MNNQAEHKIENERIQKEYLRREEAIPKDWYAPWNVASNFTLFERKNNAAVMLHEAKKFPQAGDKVLEIGYGKLGWLADLISWGLRENDLCGIELDARRAAIAQNVFPNADLQIGDASALPWSDETFDLVVTSTVFSSILNKEIRNVIAAEIERVLKPGGVLLWYDLAVNNPKNKNVQAIVKSELQSLFPKFEVMTKSTTLAPPIARLVAPRSLAATALLQALPFLRTHLLGILMKS